VKFFLPEKLSCGGRGGISGPEPPSPTFDSDFSKICSTRKMIFWWESQKKTENLFLTKISMESTLKNRDLEHHISDTS